MTFRKKSGETVEIDSDEPMTVDELKALLGETDEPNAAAIRALASRLDVVEKRPAVTPAAPAAKLDWKRASLKIVAWDGHGRIQDMIIEKIF
jgi:hypothetical protein